MKRTSRPPKLTSYKKSRQYKRVTKGEPIGGRPARDIDWVRVERLAAVQCTAIEIAFVMDIPVSTLIGREEFPSIFQKGWSRGKKSLRRKQFRRALFGSDEKGDTTMLIWLGKQYLSQTDKTQVGGPNGGPIPIAARPDLSNLSVEELERLQKLLRKATPIDAEYKELAG